jgi:hypothetical protein
MSEWIKCSEKMPNDPAWVLVYADGAINCMAYAGGQWKDWIRAQSHNIPINKITHWMPLPESPKD